MLRRLSILAFLFCAIAPAGAWHDRGHRATAHIAWEAMAPELRQRVIEALRQHPRFASDFDARRPGDVDPGDGYAFGRWLLGQASVWPDLIQTLDRDVRQAYNRSRWHYINEIVWLAPVDEAALAGRLNHNRDTAFQAPLSGDMNAIQALKGNLALWRDPSAAAADKAVALCWILHLAGDLHQPLHTVALFNETLFPAGDRGGNSIEVQRGEEVQNLHAVWDGLPTGLIDLAPSAASLSAVRSDVVDASSIDSWLRQHADLARRYVYTAELKAQVLQGAETGRPGRVRLSHEYLVAASSIARRQVNLAGYRISMLLR